jgi:hypothetical protein
MDVRMGKSYRIKINGLLCCTDITRYHKSINIFFIVDSFINDDYDTIIVSPN